MRDKDSQLRMQLQIRDEYFYVELRKRDQLLEEVIR